MGPYSPIEFGEMMGDEVAELGGIAGDALCKLRTAAGEHLSKVFSLWATISRIMSLRDAIEEASVSALRPNCSVMWSLRETIVSVSLWPASSSFDTMSPP